jgi:hypothetical protein
MSTQTKTKNSGLWVVFVFVPAFIGAAIAGQTGAVWAGLIGAAVMMVWVLIEYVLDKRDERRAARAAAEAAQETEVEA